MTLVAARRVGNAVAVSADWRLTREEGVPSIKSGTLKIVIVSANVLCAYAGLASSALDAIRGAVGPHCANGADPSMPDLLSALQDASSTGECDFIVAHTSPKIGLHKLKGGQLLRAERGTQIGDREAIERLLEAENAEQASLDWFTLEDDLSAREGWEAQSIHRAVNAVVRQQPPLRSVGEVVVGAANGPTGFQYRQSFSVALTQNHVIGDSDSAKELNQAARMVDGGSLRMNVCPASVGGVGALAVHFPQHMLAYFCYPMKLGIDAVPYAGVDSQQLVERVKNDHGVLLNVPPGT